ncbi:endonuclease 4 [subsurface metagenome]
MAIYVSTSCLINGDNVFDVLQSYARVNLEHVELGCSHRYIDDLAPAKFEPYDFTFIAHHYFPPPAEPFIVNLASPDPAVLSRSREHIKQAIDFCHSLGIKLFTFHAGIDFPVLIYLPFHAGFRADPAEKFRFPQDCPVAPYETAFTTFAESLDAINSHAQQRGIRIAIENNVLAEYNVIDGQNKFLLLCEAEEFDRLWERIASDNVGMVLDLGHLKVTSHWLNFDRYQFINRVKDRVFALHVHENDGQVDEHRELDENSWCLEVIGRNNFNRLPIVLESHKLTIGQIRQQVSLIEKFV